MLSDNCSVVSPEEFDARFRDEANIAEFASPAEESDYEARDRRLIDRIQHVVLQFAGDPPDELVCVGQDWWPDHTRHLDAVTSLCTTEFLQALRDLLSGEFAEYRVQVCVYVDSLVGDAYLGSVILYRNRTVIERELYRAIVGLGD